MNEEPHNNREARAEDVRMGYQVAVDCTIKEENLFWNQFNALLLANSILITAISFAISSQAEFTSIMAVSGIFICFLWYQLTERRSDYRNYYLLSAREIEENYMDFPVQTFSRGGDFADGSTVGMKINGRYRNHQKSFFGSLLDIRYWSFFIITIFLMIHVVFLLWSIENFREWLSMLLVIVIISTILILGIIPKARGDSMRIELEDSIFKELLDIKEREHCKTYDQTFRRLISLYRERDQRQ